MIDFAEEYLSWLSNPKVRARLTELMKDAVRSEVSAALNEEMIDVRAAAKVLGTTSAALRKAMERGQVPCVRIGRRVRFRRGELLSIADRE